MDIQSIAIIILVILLFGSIGGLIYCFESGKCSTTPSK